MRIKDGEKVQWCDEYVGRHCKRGGWDLNKSFWCNPFTKKDGCIENICLKYYWYVRQKPEMVKRLEELRGKVLGCWCDITLDETRDVMERINKPRCHAEVLMRLLYDIDVGELKVVSS